MGFRLTVLFCAAAMVLAVLSAPVWAEANVTNIFTLYMDGSLDGSDNYVGDSGGPTVPITISRDENGNAPVLDGDTIYFNGSDAGDSTVKDEVMLVDVGSEGLSMEQNYIVEAWVKPDYNEWPDTSTNANGQAFIFNWWKYYWDDTNERSDQTKRVYLRVGPDTTGSDPNYQVAAAGGITLQYPTTGQGNEETRLSGTEFTHVAVVWTWDPNEHPSVAGNVKYYVNGQLKAEFDGGLGFQPLDLPAVFGIGNFAFSGLDEGDYLSNPVNFNAGFSGWIDSFALSTFTGEFEGWEFVLADPQFCGDLGTPYKKADFNKDCVVDLQDFALFADNWMYNGFIH